MVETVGSKAKFQTTEETTELMIIRQASDWASRYLRRNVTPSNISYLIQYGRIKKVADDGNTLVKTEDLVNYYNQRFIALK